jgi:hypothetical protein
MDLVKDFPPLLLREAKPFEIPLRYISTTWRRVERVVQSLHVLRPPHGTTRVREFVQVEQPLSPWREGRPSIIGTPKSLTKELSESDDKFGELWCELSQCHNPIAIGIELGPHLPYGAFIP